MNAEIKISKNALYFALLSVGEKDSFLLRYLVPEDRQDISKYVEARDEWMKKGLVELDFDGEIHPSASFMRLLYNFSQKGAASIWKESKGMDFWIKGKLDFLKIHVEGEQACLQLQPKRSYYVEVKEQLFRKKTGILETKRFSDGKVLKDKMEKTTSPEAIAYHLQMMYEEKNDAR